jgi:hypothetical protein
VKPVSASTAATLADYSMLPLKVPPVSVVTLPG